MSDLNVYTCTGRLGADPERRAFASGDPVVSLRVAVSETWKKDGEKQERTLWLPVQITNKGICDVAEKYLSKGSRVAVSGKLQSRSYEKDGATVFVTELAITPFAGSLTLLDGAPRGEPAPQKQSTGGYSGAGSYEADDLPFIMEWR